MVTEEYGTFGIMNNNMFKHIIAQGRNPGQSIRYTSTLKYQLLEDYNDWKINVEIILTTKRMTFIH